VNCCCVRAKKGEKETGWTELLNPTGLLLELRREEFKIPDDRKKKNVSIRLLMYSNSAHSTRTCDEFDEEPRWDARDKQNC
jgi:hypothetical protein